MYEHFQALTETRQYIRAAETHERLGYLEMAATAYSKAIELAPTAELFLARGNMYERCSREATDEDKRYEMELNAFRDYSDAVKLATTPEIKRTARLRRWYLQPALLKEDFALERDWLIANTAGSELGKVLFCDLQAHARDFDLADAFEPVATLNHIIELGYRESEVYALRAEAHYLDSNFRLALEDINKAITSPKDTRTHAECLMLRANILVRMISIRDRNHLNFRDAYYDNGNTYRMNGRTNGYQSGNFEDEIFFKAILDFALERLHGLRGSHSPELREQFVQEVVRVLPLVDPLVTKDPSMSIM